METFETTVSLACPCYDIVIVLYKPDSAFLLAGESFLAWACPPLVTHEGLDLSFTEEHSPFSCVGSTVSDLLGLKNRLTIKRPAPLEWHLCFPGTIVAGSLGMTNPVGLTRDQNHWAEIFSKYFLRVSRELSSRGGATHAASQAGSQTWSCV